MGRQLHQKRRRAYRRTDLFEKRAKLMTDWATFATAPAVSGAVLPLRQRP